MTCARCGKDSNDTLCIVHSIERRARRTLSAAKVKKNCSICIVNDGTMGGVVTASVARRILTVPARVVERKKLPKTAFDVVIVPGSVDAYAASFLAAALGTPQSPSPVVMLLEDVPEADIRAYAKTAKLIYRKTAKLDEARQLVDALEQHSPGTAFGLKKSAKKLQWPR
jgi:hypothetical protein